MYYNIKIKSNGSEFSLESNDKEITQKEMDTYFACIFDVSPDFKSVIKKTQVINKSVKSINDFEKLEQKEEPVKEVKQIQPIQKVEEEKPLETVEEVKPFEVKEVQPVKEVETEESLEEKVEALAIARAQAIIKAQEMARLKEEEELKAQEEQAILEAKQRLMALRTNAQKATHNEETIALTPPEQDIVVVTTPPQEVTTVKFQNEPQIVEPQNASEIDELINLAQRRIDSLGTGVKFEDIQDEPNEVPTQAPIYNRQRIQEVNMEALNEIFSPSNEGAEAQKEVETPQYEEPQIENTPEISLTDIEISLQPQVEYEQKEEIIEASRNIQMVETPTVEDKSQYNYLPEDDEEENPTQAPQQQSQMSPTLDFKPFLASFACKKLTDEFMVCAYFIKNVLKLSSFTMKFINSKLFQATGKIADMSIIDELVTKEYIKIVEEDENKKYCISSDGEAYFASLLQE